VQGLEPTLRALNALWYHAERKGRTPQMPGAAPPSDLSPANLDATLARYGIALPKSKMAKTDAEAASVAEAIGFPVVLKIVSPDILHKTEAGGVVLNLRDGKAVVAAADKLVASAHAAHPGARIDGFLVQEMMSGVEAIVGARNDALYGPILLAGAGGVLVELTQDAALRLLPVTARDIGKMIDGLRLDKLLGGFRGQPPADRTALEVTVLALAQFFLDHRAKIDDIEINPLMVRQNGATAVDVRVIWRTTTGDA
jgi:acetyltransferase